MKRRDILYFFNLIIDSAEGKPEAIRKPVTRDPYLFLRDLVSRHRNIL